MINDELIVNDELIKQQKYIWKHVENAKEKENKFLTQLCQFGSDNFNEKNENVRQDEILDGKGIVSYINELETILLKLEMSNESRKDFDVKFESNTKIYLTQCLAFAHSNNKRFQDGVKKYFDAMKIQCSNKNSNNGTNGIMYQSAPVKLYNRCVTKAKTDYRDQKSPSAANIIDFMRFSVTFDTIEMLLQGLNLFVHDVNSGNNEHLKDIFLPNGILRIKNGFSDIITLWKSYSDAQYCDIKLNLIYIDDKGNGMIVEAQFLLKFLLKAKKMGHKLYSLIRQEEFLNQVSNQVYDVDENYHKYKLKINKLIQDRNTNNLMKQIFWKPNIVLSIVNIRETGIYPLLDSVVEEFEDKNSKFIVFFINCLFHLSYVLCNESDDENNIFLKRYLNWNQLGKNIMWRDRYYSLTNRNFYASNGIVEMMVKQKCFDGLSQLLKSARKHMMMEVNTIYHCVRQCNHLHLKLILKYKSKNEEWIKYCMGSNYAQRSHGMPLTKLVEQKNANSFDKIETLRIYIDLCDKYNKIINVETLSTVYKDLDNKQDKDDNLIQIMSMIEEYCNRKHNKSLIENNKQVEQ